jgi:surface protein
MTAFVTTWETTGVDETITLPLLDVGVYNAVVDWGDGGPTSTITAFDDADRVHTYATADTYTVSINGTCPGWGFNNGGDRLKIRTVEQWGDEAGFLSFAGGFFGCTGLTAVTATDGDAMSLVTNMQTMFSSCSSLTTLDVSDFDVTSLTDATNMLLSSSFSDSDYELLLASWSQQTLQSGVVFHAGAAKYRNTAAHDVLSDTYSWVITDGGAVGDNILDGFLWYGLDGKIYLGDSTTNVSSNAVAGKHAIGIAYGDDLMRLTVDGANSAEVAYDATLLQGTLDLFRGAAKTHKARDLRRWGVSFEDAKAKVNELTASWLADQADSPTLEFHALVPDPVTHEFTLVKEGVGTLENSRVGPINYEDADGVIAEYPSYRSAIAGVRTVTNEAPHSNDVTYSVYRTAGPVTKTDYQTLTYGTPTSSSWGNFGAFYWDSAVAKNKLAGTTLALSFDLKGIPGETIRIRLIGSSGNYDQYTATLTADWVSYGLVRTSPADDSSWGPGFQMNVELGYSATVVNIRNIHFENITGKAVQQPSEFVSAISGAVGRAYYACENNNTRTNGVLTRAVGTPYDEKPWVVSAPATINWLKQSAYLSTTPWTWSKANPPVAQAAPSGNLMWKMTTALQSDTGSTWALQSATHPSTNDLVMSAIYERDSGSLIRYAALYMDLGSGNYVGAYFDLDDNGAYSAYSGIPAPADVGVFILAPDRFRVWMKIPAASVGSASTCYFGGTRSTDPGAEIGDTFFISHAQLEEKNVSPWVETTTGAVSRPADVMHFDEGNHSQSNSAYYLEWMPVYDAVNMLLMATDKLDYDSLIGNSGGNLRSDDQTQVLTGPALSTQAGSLNRIGIAYSTNERVQGANDEWSSTTTYDGAWNTVNAGLWLRYDTGTSFNGVSKFRNIQRWAHPNLQVLKYKISSLMASPITQTVTVDGDDVTNIGDIVTYTE